MIVGVCKCLRTGNEETAKGHPPVDVFTLPFGNKPLLLVGKEHDQRVLHDGPIGPIKAHKERGAKTHRPCDMVRIAMGMSDLPLYDNKKW